MARELSKICVLGATFNTANLGVSVLAAGALRCVLHAFPNAAITQFDYAHTGYTFQFPYAGRNVDVRFANIRFSKKLHLANNIALLLALAAGMKLLRLIPGLRHWAPFRNRSLEQLQEADLVVSLAGGDSFSDIYGMRRLLYVSLPQILALLLGKRLILLPQTIGPFQRRSARYIARLILGRAEIIYCRDRASEKAARRLLGLRDADRKVRFCYDVGFDVTPQPPKQLALAGLPRHHVAGNVVVGFNVSGLLSMGGYSQDNMFGLSVPYDRLVLKLITFLVEEHNVTVLLIPHVFGESSENDVAACERVLAALRLGYEGKVGMLRGVDEYDEVKHVIGTCDFFIGSRMHACIAALSQNVPAVSIAYSDKFAGVMESIGVPDLVADPRAMSEEDIIRAVDRAFRRRAALRETLEAKMPHVKRTIQGVLSDLDVEADEGAAIVAEVSPA